MADGGPPASAPTGATVRGVAGSLDGLMRCVVLSVLALGASSATGQTGPAGGRSPADAARAFSLDLPATAMTPDRSTPAADPDGRPAALVAFTLDTPIGQLIADPRARAVLDKDLPGLSDDTNLPRFQAMSLRRFQPMTGGQLSDALLAKTGVDLAAVGPSPDPASARSLTRKRDGGR